MIRNIGLLGYVRIWVGIGEWFVFAGLLHLLIGGWVGRGFTSGELVWYRLLSNVLA